MKTFHGKPCKKCNGTLRYMQGKKPCAACKIKSDRAYHERNKTQANEKNRARYWSNRDVHNERNKISSRARHVADPRKAMLRMAAQRAKTRGFPCTVTLEDIKIPECCPLLGIKLAVGAGRLNHNSPSLDRILNTYGYVRGNVAVISHRANTLKRDAQSTELLTLSFRLAEMEASARTALYGARN